MTEYIDNLIAEALGQVHGQSSRRRYSVAEVKQIVYPLIGALRDPAALESVQRPFPVDGAPMGGDPAVVVRGAVQSDVATSAPDVVMSPGYGKPVAVQPVTPDRDVHKKVIQALRGEARAIREAGLTPSRGDLFDIAAEVLAASGVLGQPQPQPNAKVIEGARQALNEFDAITPEDYWGSVPHHLAASLRALLPLLGQPRTDVIAETIREFEDLYFGPGVQTRTWVANAMRQRHGLPPRDAEPRTDAPLDPYPWRDRDGRKHAAFGPPEHLSMRGSPWAPDPEFEQDQARYPRTDTTEPGDKP